MLRHERSAPIWLFSFVDLAFLLLIAFTQIGPRYAEADLDLATLELPRIQGPGTPLDAPAPAAAWQLRIHPIAGPVGDGIAHAPYFLIEPGSDAAAAPAQDIATLTESLTTLDLRGAPKPILAPHRDARAEDLLVAVALLDETWDGTRSTAVRPSPAGQNAAVGAR